MSKHNLLAGSVSAAALTAVAMTLRPGMVFAGPGDATGILAGLRSQLDDLTQASDAIIAKADTEGRDLTEEELGQIAGHAEKGNALRAQISAREFVVPQGQGRRTLPEPGQGNTPGNPAQARATDPRGGFKSFGEFAMAVRNSGRPGASQDNRLNASALGTFGNEQNGADGGFGVPPEFRTAIWQKVMDEENLLSRCDPMECGGNSMTFPKDETTPWQNTGGVQVYWENEAAQIGQSKPQLELDTMRLAKLTALVPISEELLEDAPGLQSWLLAKAPSKMAAKLNTALVRGTGVGQPLGILKAPSTIIVPEEDGQAADTVLFANISKMWSRMYAPCRRNAIWLINQDIEPQLDALAFDNSATSKVPLYMPSGGLSASPYSTLKGRPVIPMEACSTVGDVGDIMLVDMTQYMALTKAGQGVRTDVSMHLWFDQAVQAFRFIFRVNGKPWWGKSVERENGGNSLSWAVALAARA